MTWYSLCFITCGRSNAAWNNGTGAAHTSNPKRS